MIDAMTLAEVEELFAYWSAHPPVHLMVAAYLGIKPKPRSADAAARRELLAIPGITERPVGEGLPAAILDFAELRRRASGPH